MTAVNYFVDALDSTNSNLPHTGLTPTWVYFRSSVTGADISPQPVITEPGSHGRYAWSYDATASGEANGRLDFGAAMTVAADRYVYGNCGFASPLQPSDISTIAFSLDAPLTGHNIPGTVGASLTNIETAPPTLAQIVAGVIAAIGSAASTVWKQVY